MVIPSGLQSVLKPLDIALNKPVTDSVCELYNEWTLGDNQTMLTVYLQWPLLLTVCDRVSPAWKLLRKEMVHKPFRKYSIGNVVDSIELDALRDMCNEKRSSSDLSLDNSK